MMKLLVAGAILSLLAVEAAAFTPQSSAFSRSGSVSLNLLKDESEKSMLEKALGREVRGDDAGIKAASVVTNAWMRLFPEADGRTRGSRFNLRC